MNWAEIRKMLGLGDDVPEDKVKTLLQERVDLAKTVDAKVTEITNLSQKVTAHETEITKLKTDLTSEQNKVVTLSQKASSEKPTAQSLYFARQAFQAKKDAALKDGAITPATMDKLVSKYLGNIDLNSISLSRAVTDADISLNAGLISAIDVLDTLEGNKPSAKPGEQTTNQNGNTTTTTTTNTKAGELGPDGKPKKEEEEKDSKAARAKIYQNVMGGYKGPKKREEAKA